MERDHNESIIKSALESIHTPEFDISKGIQKRVGLRPRIFTGKTFVSAAAVICILLIGVAVGQSAHRIGFLRGLLGNDIPELIPPLAYSSAPTLAPTPTPIPRVPRQEFLDYRAHYGNDDIIGRVWIPNTTVDYLVAQGTDNDFYLHHCLRGRRYRPGSIFLDYMADVHGQDQNWVLYGHNMARNHKFNNVRHFALNRDFFNNHRFIYFSTIYADYVFEVFSSYVTHIDFQYTWANYDHFPDGWDYWISEFARLSAHYSGITVSGEDRILTLSTCHPNPAFRNYRIAVHARLISMTFPHLDGGYDEHVDYEAHS